MAINLKKAVQVARSQRGYREQGNNKNKFSPAVPGLEWSNYQPWCATFTCWVFLQAGGKPNVDFPLTASCLAQVAWGRKHGRFYKSPKVGDLMMLGPNGGTHVELVVEVRGGIVVTVGGNTSGSWGGNYANGDGVYEKSRSASSAYGYVRPYTSGSGTVDSSVQSWGGLVSTRSVLSQQKAVNYLRWILDMPQSGHIAEDGDGGPETLKGVKWLQKTVGTGSDGQWGPATQKAYTNYLLKNKKHLDYLASKKKAEAEAVPNGSPVLKKGAKGTKVKQLQSALMRAGERLPKYKDDGDFGDETVKAVKSFQKKNKLTQDGEYGPKTATALKKKLS